MRDKGTEGWGSLEPFYIMLNDYPVADMIITHHAKNRYLDRISTNGSDEGEIAAWMWQSLKKKRIRLYPQHGEQNVYLIDDDIVVAAEFNPLKGAVSSSGKPLYRMIIVSFIGRISATPQLRDMKRYYSWQRHIRRLKMVKKKHNRK